MLKISIVGVILVTTTWAVKLGDKCFDDEHCRSIGASCHNDNHSLFGTCKCKLTTGHGYSISGSPNTCFTGAFSDGCDKTSQCLDGLSCLADYHDQKLGTKKCQCQAKQYYNVDTKSCRDAMDGDPCRHNACSSDLMECISTHICECRHGSYLDSGNQKQCKLDVVENDIACNHSPDCSRIVNGTRKEKFKCRKNKCVCSSKRRKMFVVKETSEDIAVNKCMSLPKRLGDACDDRANVEGANCSKIKGGQNIECVSNKCSCKAGYVKHKRNCVKASLKLKKELWALFWGKITTYATGLYIDFIDEGKFLFEDLKHPYDFRAEFYEHLLNRMNFSEYTRSKTNSYECTFNGSPVKGKATSTMCDIVLEPKKGKINQVWQMTDTLTPVTYTGPSSHHGYYLYFEGSTVKAERASAVFYLPTTSFKNKVDSDYCLLFDYNVYGLDTGDLSVHVVDAKQRVPGNPLWTSTGSTSGKYFYNTKLDVRVKAGQTVSFVGKKTKHASDMSVDRIMVRLGKCFHDPY